MATEEVLTISDHPDTPEAPDVLEALDGWEVELVFDGSADVLQPLAAAAVAAETAPFATAATAASAPPAPQNLVQVAVWPTVHEAPVAPTTCVRLLAASLIGLGTLLAASALFGR